MDNLIANFKNGKYDGLLRELNLMDLFYSEDRSIFKDNFFDTKLDLVLLLAEEEIQSKDIALAEIMTILDELSEIQLDSPNISLTELIAMYYVFKDKIGGK